MGDRSGWRISEGKHCGLGCSYFLHAAGTESLRRSATGSFCRGGGGSGCSGIGESACHMLKLFTSRLLQRHHFGCDGFSIVRQRPAAFLKRIRLALLAGGGGRVSTDAVALDVLVILR